MKVDWDDDIPNISGKMQKMATKPPTRKSIFPYGGWNPIGPGLVPIPNESSPEIVFQNFAPSIPPAIFSQTPS